MSFMTRKSHPDIPEKRRLFQPWVIPVDIPQTRRLSLMKWVLIMGVMLINGVAFAALEVAPGSYDFGRVPVGHSSKEQAFTISSRYPVRLGLIETVTTMIDAFGNQTTVQSDEFILSDDPCSNTEINFGKNCQVTVTFRPIMIGAKTAHLIVRATDSSVPIVDIPLSGNGTDDPNIEVSLKSYDFGELEVGKTSPSQIIMIRNTGKKSLEMGTISLAGDKDNFLFQDYCSNTRIIPSAYSYCTLRVAFKPLSEGLKKATISIPSNDPDTPMLEIALSGGSNVVKTPNIEVAPLTEDFGEIQVGSASFYKMITISNSGTAYLQLGQLTLSGEDFGSLDDLCSNQKVRPGGNCYMNIRFAPKTIGAKVERLSIPSDDPDMPLVKALLTSMSLISCNNFEFSAYPNSPDFGTELIGHPRTLSQNIYLNAYGCVSGVRVEDIKITGTNAKEFDLSTRNCSHGSSGDTFYSTCGFYTTFTPTSAGTKNAELTAIFNDNTQKTIPILATALATGQPNFEVSPSNHDFGVVALTYGNSSSQKLTVRNTGNVNLAIEPIEITGPNRNEFYADGCASLIYPSQECQIEIFLRGSYPLGNKQANLLITSNSITKEVFLTGRVIDQADCSAENITIESVADGPWANKTPGTNNYDQPSIAWKRLHDFTVGENSTPNQPRSGDIVLIKAGHKITGIPEVRVKTFCIELGGILESLDDHGTSLTVSVDYYTENKGSIQGKDGADEASDATSCSTGYESSIGTDHCAQPGASIFLSSPYGRLFNTGTIIAGHGGNGKQFSAPGGSIDIVQGYGMNNTSDTGIIEAGRGGNIISTQSGQAGQGGFIHVLAQGPIKSDGKRILAGNGGDCNPDATEPQTGGNGGNLSFYSAVAQFGNPDSLPRKATAGQGGTNCEPLGTNGKNGNGTIEPNLVTFSGNIQIEGNNITLFGGQDWLLDLRNLNGNIINALGNLTIAAGEGGAIDMRGSTGKLLKAGGQVTIFANDILLDKGVTLDKLIEATNIVLGPSKVLYDVSLTGPNKASGMLGKPLSIRLQLANGGPQLDTYLLSVTDSAGWELGNLPSSIQLEGLETTELMLDVTVPAMLGEMDIITVTAISQADPSVTATLKMQVIAETRGGNGLVTPPPQPLSTCASDGTIDWTCRNNRDQLLTNVIIETKGNVAGGILAGEVTNKGIISQVKVQSGAVVNGGKLTGYINNEGTLANFEFVGAEISGGTLAGTVNNNSQVGGTFKDVHLAADTHLRGGYLQGNIMGDKDAPALLENVTIKSDSLLSGVKLGEGVMLEAKVTCGEGVQAQKGVCPSEIELPPLRATATNAQGEPMMTAAIFSGGISVNQGTFESPATLTIADLVDILGQVQVDPLDLGQAAEVVVYVNYKPITAKFSDPPVYFMLNEKGDILSWDEDIKNLVAFQAVAQLVPYLEVPMYQGPLPATGHLKISFGYRLNNEGTVVHNLEPLEVTITE